MEAIKIMFSTKKYLNKKNNNGCTLRGHAYYVFDKQGVINKQFIQIIEGEYRQTDYEMAILIKKDGKPGTDFYRIEWKRDFRTKYLDEQKHNPNDFTIKSPRKQLSKEQIEKINDFFISNNSPVLTQSSLMMGSNSTGAEQNPLSTPLMSLDKDYLKYNFANTLNKFYKNVKINLENINELKTITLKQYFKRYNNVDIVGKKANLSFNTLEVFNDINYHRILIDKAENDYVNNFESDKLILPLSINKKSNIRKDVSVENIREYLWELIGTFKDVELTEQQIRNKLTHVYNYGIQTLIKNKKLSYSSFEEFPNPENAHIISKASLLKKQDDESLFKSADPFNCLRLSPSTHTSFDKNLITFTPDGKIIDTNGKVLINDPIHDILSSPQRMKYINENYEHWKQNKCNK